LSEYMSVLSQVRQYGIRALNKQINRLDGSCGHGELSERKAHATVITRPVSTANMIAEFM